MGTFRTFGWFLLILFTVAAFSGSGEAQTINVSSEWETLRPETEEFGILMPRNSTAETSKEPYHKMTLNIRLYLWASPAGPVFAVASISGIKSNPAMYTEMERVNSYVDAFKRWFPAKIRGKAAIAKLTLAKEKHLNGHAGREYKLVVGDLSGVAQVYATRRRFYAVVALNTTKDDALSERFLSSFVLPDRINEAPPTIAAQQRAEKQLEAENHPEYAPNSPGQKSDPAKPEGKPAGETGATDSDAKAVEPAPTSDATAKRAPISGGVLNGKAISLPFPPYPAIARQAKAAGVVVVQVTIDEYGNIIAARAVSGHPLLQAVSVAAAREAKFSPTFLMGEAVKVTGVITYNFVAQ
jgi:protein TonB